MFNVWDRQLFSMHFHFPTTPIGIFLKISCQLHIFNTRNSRFIKRVSKSNGPAVSPQNSNLPSLAKVQSYKNFENFIQNGFKGMFWVSYQWKFILTIVSSFLHSKKQDSKDWKLSPLISNLVQNNPKFTYESCFFQRSKLNFQNVS